ncbi:bifunctional GNAT family N-acetyltransferase/carbon-nitrogen hydrolase family protein [Maricaulis sp.]|uniref:bifunctional GNAT family N-acetyltransferase/carbon-nitrogen hydrolase family protein n=1 Tax=Maricaulis sp. TaxID=1486257 RepID=UPI001B158E56|nr:bifunctional GNAT family N-acetyltransferase/carbon-nitrogen hydrolase family protein [Maricaulis sp.]MBO6765731.1 GNAT family N-acetyltransferase [Maricaulis sp.]
MPRQTSRSALNVRNATLQDIPGIVALSGKVYPVMGAYSESEIQGQLINFPEGQVVVEYEGEVVGYAASFMIDEAAALSPHTWDAITGNGYASRHNPKGDWLYGMEICVDPDRRRLRIGQRLYDARRELAERLELKGIVFGGRMPHWKRRRKQYSTPKAYLAAVMAQEVADPVIRFQTRMGFEPIGVLKAYLPSDRESGGYATHMVWRNPYAIEQTKSESAPPGSKDVVRVATVQFQQRRVSSFEEFIGNIEYFVSVTSDYRSDFVVFPELFTLQLLALEETRLTHAQSIERLTEYTPRFVEEMRQMAISYNINIIGGSHPTRTDDGDIQNVAYVFLRDGSVHAQEKIHPTPSERHWWNIKGGDQLGTIQTDCGPVGILICYDSEFPELARKLADEGAKIFFVPFCTDNRQGYMRVRYCSQARAIENQCYVVMSGNVGNLPGVENMDIQYAKSCILTPCDFNFARDGIAEECSENVETVSIADLDLTDLDWARQEGTVRNLRDRRFDLYAIRWKR